MKGVPQGRYTREFRQEAVKLVTEEYCSNSSLPARTSVGISATFLYV